MNDDWRIKQRERDVQREMATCVHFNGIQHDRCAAGVPLVSVRVSSATEPNRWPCLRGVDLPCANRHLPDRDEAERRHDERDALVSEMLSRSARGICVTCGDQSTDWDQVGACIYSQPCGHRVGQGNAAGFKASVLKKRASATEAKP
jgi:hypothetical protein